MARNRQGEQTFLRDIKQNVELAESRCNMLTQQVGIIKNSLYDKTGNSEVASEPISVSSSSCQLILQDKQNQHEIASQTDQSKLTNKESRKTVGLIKNFKSDLSTVPQRDPNSSIRKLSKTETANNSINNIISGITASVNKLTHLQVHIAPTNSIIHDSAGIQNVKCSVKNAKEDKTAEKPYQNEKGTPSVTTKPKSPKRVKRKTRQCENDTPKKQASLCSLEKVKPSEMKANEKDRKVVKSTRISGTRISSAKFKNKPYGRTFSSRTFSMKAAPLIRKSNHSQNLVELYHNKAMQFDTMSGDNLAVNTAEVIQETNSPLLENESRRGFLPPIKEHKILNTNVVHNNYTLPTVASKMKQVTKHYQNFNFRTIPFVPARSITQSHNLGINIQQMLSTFKGYKPIALSPTLVHNIALATNSTESDPMLLYMSAFGSQIQNFRFPCPVDRNTHNNYECSQELHHNETGDGANNNNCAALAGSGNKAASAGMAGKSWTNNSVRRNSKCTCVRKSGAHFDEICAKYLPGIKPHQPQAKKPKSKFGVYPNCSSTIDSEATYRGSKQANLKPVLDNLCKEFEQLNNQHDELYNKIANSPNENKVLVKEMQNLQQQLHNKEQEIETVTNLYQEVVQLKKQINTMNGRYSHPAVGSTPIRQRVCRDNNPKTHLLKLLRDVQNSLRSYSNI